MKKKLFFLMLCVLFILLCIGILLFPSDRSGPAAETEPKPTLEEFLNSIENPQIRILYEQLYDLYDYETFDRRSPIPQYFQTVYTDKFSVGTIQSAGCGITSLSMVASFLFEEEITPDWMLRYDCGPNPAAAMEAGIEDLKLNCKTWYGDAATEKLDGALDAGKPVIVLHQSGSYFTKSGHFFVIAGKNPDGSYIVNDPNMINYLNPRLVDGYTHGFSREDITAGLVGLYIFDSKEEFTDRRGIADSGKENGLWES